MMPQVKGSDHSEVDLVDSLYKTVLAVRVAQRIYGGTARGTAFAAGQQTLVTSYTETAVNGLDVAQITLSIPLSRTDAPTGATVSPDISFDDDN